MLSLVLFSLINFAVANDDETNNVKYQSKTEIDFEGLEIEGELVKPTGALLLERRSANFNPLITLRNSFDIEMRKSVNDIK